MAPLPPSNTARYRFHYTTIGQAHTVQVRATSSPSSIAGFFNAYMLAFGSDIFQTTLDFVEWAPNGSDIFNPVSTVYDGTSYGAGFGNVVDVPRAYTFIGRTPGGRRVRMAQFGAKFDGSNYRFTAGENAQIDAVIALLNAPGSQLLGIDGLLPNWKSYADVQLNDHWITEVRP
jgi:hypothetical protein